MKVFNTVLPLQQKDCGNCSQTIFSYCVIYTLQSTVYQTGLADTLCRQGLPLQTSFPTIESFAFTPYIFKTLKHTKNIQNSHATKFPQSICCTHLSCSHRRAIKFWLRATGSLEATLQRFPKTLEFIIKLFLFQLNWGLPLSPTRPARLCMLTT